MFKKLVLISFIVISPISFAKNGNWYFSSEKINGTKTYNVYGIDQSIENAISITCDEKMKNPIMAIQVNETLLNKEKSIVSFKFDSEEKIKITANYNDNVAWSTDSEIGTSDFAKIIDKLKKSTKVEVGFVTNKNKSSFFTVDLNGSSDSINELSGKCSSI